jgi:phage shock protein E
MTRKVLRMAMLTLVAVIVVVAMAVGAFYLHDQTNLAAQARATPQVPPEAAAQAPNPVAVDLPPEVNVATAHLLNGRPDVTLLDVRSQGEYAQGHIPGATLIPLNQLPDRLAEVPRDRTVIVACRSGNRSTQAVKLLRAAGFTNIHNLVGGLRAWDKAGFAQEGVEVNGQ